MRKNGAFVSLVCLTAALFAGCNQGTDPALLAAIKAGNSPAVAAPTVDTSALESKVDALSLSLTGVSTEVASLKRSVGSDVSDVGDRLRLVKAQLEELDAISKKIKAATESGAASAALTALQTKFAGVETSINEVKLSMQGLNLEKYIEVANAAADAQGQIFKAKEDLRRSQEALAAMTAERDAQIAAVADLKDSIEGLKGADVSKHPVVKDLKKKLETAAERERKLKEDYDAMKLLADSQADEIRQLKAGGAVVSAGTKPEAAIVRAFTYKVSSATFRADTQQYTVLANFLDGQPPAEGSEVLIVDLDDNPICRMRVDKIYPAEEDLGLKAQIGGETVNANTRNAPLPGYRVVSSRAVGAEGR